MNGLWICLLILGLISIIAALLLRSFKNCENTILWILFAIGIILLLLAAYFFLYESSCLTEKKLLKQTFSPEMFEKSKESNMAEPSPEISQPIMNQLQAQRGFTATNLSLESLAPRF